MKLKAIATELEAAGSTICKSELRSFQRVLRRLTFIDEDGVVLKKGQVALCINSADELVLTDMLFHGDLNNMEPHQIAATCSCFIWREGTSKKSAKVCMGKMFDVYLSSQVAVIEKYSWSNEYQVTLSILIML